MVLELMRPALVTMLLLGACGDSGKPAAPDAKLLIDGPVASDAPMIDASAIDAPMVDAPTLDAMVDAAPPSMEAMTACMHACDAIATCEGVAPSSVCYSECGADLGDCTMQQVMDVDTCSQAACASVVMCLQAIACVQG